MLAHRDAARIVLAAPVVFILHVVEEAPGFVRWFNSRVLPGITGQMFWSVNGAALFITVVLAALAGATRDRVALLLCIGWLSFLMFANAIFHVIATVVHARYSSGAITAVLLYLPYFGWLTWRAIDGYRLRPALVAIVCTLFAAPMVIHGYRIVFEGRRLF